MKPHQLTATQVESIIQALDHLDIQNLVAALQYQLEECKVGEDHDWETFEKILEVISK